MGAKVDDRRFPSAYWSKLGKNCQRWIRWRPYDFLRLIEAGSVIPEEWSKYLGLNCCFLEWESTTARRIGFRTLRSLKSDPSQLHNDRSQREPKYFDQRCDSWIRWYQLGERLQIQLQIEARVGHCEHQTLSLPATLGKRVVLRLRCFEKSYWQTERPRNSCLQWIVIIYLFRGFNISC